MMMLDGSFLLTSEFKINSLFDIVVDEKSLRGAEKVFCHDHKTRRICRLSEEEWVKEQLAMLEPQQYQIQYQLQQQQYENEEMDSEDQNVKSSMMDTSVNRSGIIRIMALHTDAKLIAIDQVSYSVFLITADLFCALYFLHSKTGHELLNYLLRLKNV